MKRLLCTLSLLLLIATGSACSEPETYRWKLATSNGRVFTTEVMPVLLRDCGFPTCHGSPERFFQIYGPGRSRLDPTTPAFKNQTGPEITASYNAVLSFVDAERPGRSPLLRKPLAREAGGAGHLGTDRYGRDVYRTVNDPGYLVLAKWVFMATPAPPPQAMPMMMTPPAMAGAPAPAP